jgi:uncharacterized membrane protein YvbJ
MFCRSCGTQNADGMPTCTACGAPLSANPSHAANPYQTGSLDSQLPQAPAGGKPDNFLVAAILTTICCCPILGIVGIVYAAQVDSKWNAGDYAGAVQYAKNAKTWTLIGLGIGALWVIAQIVFVVIGGVAGANPGPGGGGGF